MHDVEFLAYSLGCSAAFSAAVSEYVRTLPVDEQVSLTDTMYQRIAGNDVRVVEHGH